MAHYQALPKSFDSTSDPLTLSLSKGARSWFDRLTTSGLECDARIVNRSALGFQRPVSWYNGGVGLPLQNSLQPARKSPQPPFAKGGWGGFPRRLIAAASCLMVLFLLAGHVAPRPALAQSPYDESQAQAIDRMLMCPVCPGETIDQSQVELARQMRLRVREMLAQGAGRQEVLDFFVARYGAGVLAAPPKSGFNLVAWLFPVLAVPLALAAGLLALRAMRRRAPPSPEPMSSPDAGLEPFLMRVDQELTVAAPAAPAQAGGPADG